MAKKRQSQSHKPHSAGAEKPATLKDLLRADVLDKLKQQANELQAAEDQRKEAARKQAEAERKAEQKRRDNDFAYLLEHSEQDWKKFK